MHTDDGHVLYMAPTQLLLDMKVRWSSTFLILCHALNLKEVSTSWPTFAFSAFLLLCRMWIILFAIWAFKKAVLINTTILWSLNCQSLNGNEFSFCWTSLRYALFPCDMQHTQWFTVCWKSPAFILISGRASIAYDITCLKSPSQNMINMD